MRDPADVGKRVERARRLRARDAGKRIESLDDRVATHAELRDHRAHVVVGSGQRRDPRFLDERCDARIIILSEERRELRHLEREHAVAEPPTRHRVRLRKSVEDRRPFAHPVERGDRDELRVVDVPRVDLVGDDREIVPDRELRDRFEIGSRQHAARRILRRVEDDELRLRRDRARESIEIEPEAGRFDERDRHGDRIEIVGASGVRGIGGIGVDHLVARTE